MYVTEADLTLTLQRLRDEVLQMTPPAETTVEYTVIINQENSNPKTACTYADDAVFMYPGDIWDKKPIFKDIKPCVFANGEVVYYLNPNDWTKKVDGTDSVLTGADGNVMIEFPKCAYRIYTGDNNVLYVSVTNDATKVANDNRYTYDAFSRAELGDRDKIYIGAFPGYIDNNILTSRAGVQPTGSKTIEQFRTAAQAAGSHYQQLTWAQIKLLQCLYLIKYRNRDGQRALGYGVVSGSKTTTGYETTSTSNLQNYENTFSKGMCFGDKTVKTKHMRCFGLEDFWGNTNDWVDGLTTSASHELITSWNSYSNEVAEPTSTTTSSGYTSNFSGQPKYVQGTTDLGFMPRTTNKGSTTTYWPDNANLSASCVLCFGGSYGSDLYAGPFYLSAGNGTSYSGAGIGSRLSFV